MTICCGIALTSIGEVAFHFTGFVISFFAMLFGASKLILLEFLLSDTPTRLNNFSKLNGAQQLEDSPLEATSRSKLSRVLARKGEGIPPLLILFYLSGVTFVTLIPAFFAFEYGRLEASDHSSYGPSTLGYLFIGACLAFGMNMCSILVIRYTSALTLAVCGAARLILLIGLTTVLFGHRITPLNVVGIIMCVIGVGMYNYVRLTIFNAKAAEPEAMDQTEIQSLIVNPTTIRRRSTDLEHGASVDRKENGYYSDGLSYSDDGVEDTLLSVVDGFGMNSEDTDEDGMLL